MQQSKTTLFPFLLLALLALIAGLWAGLLRLGWDLPAGRTPLPMDHGPIMVSGFLGTLIALERVAALRKKWMFLGPLSSGAGWAASLALPSTLVGPLLITLGSIVFVAILIVIIRREPRIFTVIMGLGSLGWLVGNLFWLSGRPVYTFVFWWAVFLILTVAGERLELSRVLRPTKQVYRLFALAVAVFIAGAVINMANLNLGSRVAGVGIMAMALWLGKYDIARRNLRHSLPLTRFIAACLFTGYIWLGISGLIALAVGGQTAGGYYDALLHTIFVGFIISMIFGHAPIIIPALTGVMITFTPWLYTHLVILHISLVLRVAGDLLGWPAGRQWGGLLNEVAILLFLFLTIISIVGARRKTHS